MDYLDGCMGWECPRCHAVNAPSVKQCPCSIKEFAKARKDKLVKGLEVKTESEPGVQGGN